MGCLHWATPSDTSRWGGDAVRSRKKRLSVLFLTPVFPDERHPAAGTFVRRHAEAIGRFCDVYVVHLEEEKPERDTLRTRIVHEDADGFHLLHVYYSGAESRTGRVVTPNILRPVRAALEGLHVCGADHIDIVHGNMTRGAGLAALMVSRTLGVPYVVTEHHTGLLRDNSPEPALGHRALMHLVVADAGAVTVVSQGLAEAMADRGLRAKRYDVIANVAEPTVTPLGRPPFDGRIPFVHVSFLLDVQKNVSGLLRAVRTVADKRQDFRLHLVGSGPDAERLRAYTTELELDDFVVFEGLKRHEEVLASIADFAFLVMFSNYETFCVALAEAIATGIPVISPDIVGPQDFMSPEVGLTVKAGDEADLADAIHWMLDHYAHFPAQQLRDYAAERFSVERIGKQFESVYREVLAAGRTSLPRPLQAPRA